MRSKPLPQETCSTSQFPNSCSTYACPAGCSHHRLWRHHTSNICRVDVLCKNDCVQTCSRSPWSDLQAEVAAQQVRGPEWDALWQGHSDRGEKDRPHHHKYPQPCSKHTEVDCHGRGRSPAGRAASTRAAQSRSGNPRWATPCSRPGSHPRTAAPPPAQCLVPAQPLAPATLPPITHLAGSDMPAPS